MIDVNKYREWSIRKLSSKPVATVCEFDGLVYPLPLSQWPHDAIDQWRELLTSHHINRVVCCLGASTVYSRLHNEESLPNSRIAFRKGVVGRIPAKIVPEDAVILFEGGMFDRDSLYVVPHEDCFILGGTITPASTSFDAGDWTVSEDEKQGIIKRAESFLPNTDQARRLLEGLSALDSTDVWIAGVRPKLQSVGPISFESAELSHAFSSIAEQEVDGWVHFGHGGSGYTFCYDTASQLLKKMSI